MAPPREEPAALFRRFLTFGFLAWGGPVAQIAMIRRQLVEEEGWIGPERFNRVLAVYQALPGPEAHELCVFFGHLAGGRLGGVMAGLGFMLPGFVLMLALAWVYVRFGIEVGVETAIFAGVQAAVIALIARGAFDIGRHALTGPWLWAIGALGFAASVAGAHFAVVLVVSGLVYLLVRQERRAAAVAVAVGAAALVALWPALRAAQPLLGQGMAAAPVTDPSLWRILATGLAAGLLTFGGAYTAIPIVGQPATGPGGWMTQGQLLDGLALGGILPAPLIIFGTFIGYVGAGLPGAMIMTAAIFLPAFAFTLAGYRTLERLVADRRLHALFDGITAGVVGLIAATTVRLLPAGVPGPFAAVVAVAALVVLLAWRQRAAIPLVLLGAALAGAVRDVAL